MTVMLLEKYGLDPYITDAEGDNLAHQIVSCQDSTRSQDVLMLLK